MGVIFLLTGMFIVFFAMAFESGEFKNTLFKWLCMSSGCALIIGFFKGTTDFNAYLFFIAIPVLIFIYTYFKQKDNY